MSAPPFASLADLIGGWSEDVLTGTPPVRWKAGTGALATFPVGPGLVTLIGGPPAAGKTALGNQLAFDAARLNPELRVQVTCCEMPTAVLLDRQLTRLAGVPYSAVRGRALTADHRAAVAPALATLRGFADRLAFHAGPFTLDAVEAAADGCGADLVLIGYLQRLTAPGVHSDKRGMTNAILDAFRGFADAGCGVLVLSSVGRQPTGRHGQSGYAGLNLASFKESGDIEYMTDDAFLLPPADDGITTLHHVKARHTEQTDITLRSNLAFMRFDPLISPVPAAADLRDRARAAWAGTPPPKGVRR